MSLRKYIKNNKNARKIFGKKEIEIILKQLDGIVLTQSERNRLSRDIRLKLLAVRELAEFREDFRLETSQDNRRMIDKAVHIITEDMEKDRIQAILLFGSMVTGKRTPRSDIDIAIVCDQMNLSDATKMRIRILGQLSDNLDIQIFNTLPQKIKRAIAKNHRVLFKTNKFDNIEFTLQHRKYQEFFARRQRIFGDV